MQVLLVAQVVEHRSSIAVARLELAAKEMLADVVLHQQVSA
jgi:hypothetical protein